jgi:hypothetical protein
MLQRGTLFLRHSGMETAARLVDAWMHAHKVKEQKTWRTDQDGWLRRRAR